MTTICLIRHGETDWNALGKLQGQTDVPLNEKGLQQAQACGQFLQTYKWDVLISSPLTRAYKTAVEINKTLHLPLVIMREFTERSFGHAEGMTKEERETVFPKKNYPEQEHYHDLLNRLLAGLNDIHDHYPNQRVLLVTHGAVIHTLLDYFSNGEIGKKRFKLFNGGLNHIHYEQSEWKVKAYNQVSHLS